MGTVEEGEGMEGEEVMGLEEGEVGIKIINKEGTREEMEEAFRTTWETKGEEEEEGEDTSLNAMLLERKELDWVLSVLRTSIV